MESSRSRNAPFIYGKSRLTRQHSPGRYQSVSRYRNALREEFGQQCVYCRLPEGLAPRIPFEVDHYRPVAKYPAGKFEYENLFWSCRGCNGRKSEYWSDPSVHNGHFIPNPCSHAMFAHLRFDDGSVVPKSNAGRFAAELLDLNEPDTVVWRETVTESVVRWIREARRFASGLERLRAQLAQAGSSNTMAAQAALKLQDSFDAIVQKLALYGVKFEG